MHIAYTKLYKQVKGKAAAFKHCAMRTGGGSPPKPDLTPIEEHILEFIPMESVEGIHDGVEIVAGTAKTEDEYLNLGYYHF